MAIIILIIISLMSIILNIKFIIESHFDLIRFYNPTEKSKNNNELIEDIKKQDYETLNSLSVTNCLLSDISQSLTMIAEIMNISKKIK